MDIIFMLLAIQLLIVFVIILTDLHLKKTAPLDVIKTRLANVIVPIIGLKKGDMHLIEKSSFMYGFMSQVEILINPNIPENTDTGSLDKAVQSSASSCDKQIPRHIADDSCKLSGESAIETDEMVRNNFLTSLQTPSTMNKFSRRESSHKPWRHLSKPSSRKSAKTAPGDTLSINSVAAVTACGLQQVEKPVESVYLSKLISLRKTESNIRLKLSKINHAILRARVVRPLPVIREVAEASS